MPRIFLSILLTINSISFLLISFWTYKFVRFFGLRKKLQLMFILMVCIASFGRASFFIVDFISRGPVCQVPPPGGVEMNFFWANPAMFTSAVIVNVFSWLYQKLRLEKLLTGQRKNQIGYHIIFGITLGVELVMFVGLSLISGIIYGRDLTIFKILVWFYAIKFILVSIAFTVVGIIFYKKFREVAPENARKKRNRIFLSIFIISTTFMLRGVINLIDSILISEWTYTLRWIDNNRLFINIVWTLYSIVVDALPSLYLSFTIHLITQEHKKRYMSQNSNADNSLQKRLSFGEDSFKEDTFMQKNAMLETGNGDLSASGISKPENWLAQTGIQN